MAKKCYLRQTDVLLADGKKYKFTALPVSSKTLPIIEIMMRKKTGDFHMAKALYDAVFISLSYSYSDEEIESMLDSGLVQFENKEIMNAMVAGFLG